MLTFIYSESDNFVEYIILTGYVKFMSFMVYPYRSCSVLCLYMAMLDGQTVSKFLITVCQIKLRSFWF